MNRRGRVRMNRSYQIVCPSCQGRGTIDPPYGLSNNTQEVCPACQGSGTVLCTETGGTK